MRQRSNLPAMPAALLVIATALCLSSASTSAAQPKGIDGFMEAFGIKPITPRDKIDEPFRLTFIFNYIEHDVENIPSGGLISFGAFDSGEVLLLAQVEYMPNLSQASYHRKVYPPNRMLEPSETPRYVMLCALPTEEDGQSHDPILYAYAERDDANSEIDKSAKAFWSVSVKWRPVPVKRAQSKFSAQDYCGEFLKTKQSLVPLWLPETDYK